MDNNMNEYNQNQNNQNQDFKPNQSYQYDPNGVSQQPKGDNMALASMVCGILSIVMCCCMGIFSIILGVAAMILFKKSKDMDGGVASSMALVGMICGIIGCVTGVFSIAYWILFFMGIVSSAAMSI